MSTAVSVVLVALGIFTISCLVAACVFMAQASVELRRMRDADQRYREADRRARMIEIEALIEELAADASTNGNR